MGLLADELELYDQLLSLATIRCAGGLRVLVQIDACAAATVHSLVVLPELLEMP